MKRQLTFAILFLVSVLLIQCTTSITTSESESEPEQELVYTGEFDTQLEWGEHLVVIGGCHDCHTPKKMGLYGPVLDTALWLSGFQADRPRIDMAYADAGGKGLAVTSDLTEWLGPWGTSYTANLTPHATGIGEWSEENFIRALREGKLKGIEGGRQMLPPMPWEMYKYMTDAEIKAIFAYLKTIDPIDNIVPPPIPPGAN